MPKETPAKRCRRLGIARGSNSSLMDFAAMCTQKPLKKPYKIHKKNREHIGLVLFSGG